MRLIVLVILAIASLAPTSLVAGPGDGFPDPGGGAQSAAVRVSTALSQNGVTPGDRIDVAVVLEMGDGWHVNSDRPNEEWLIPTAVLLDDSPSYSLEEVVYPTAHDLPLSFSETPMSVFEGTAPVGLRLSVSPDVEGVLSIEGTITYQACNDETCLAPVDEPITFNVPVLASASEIEPRRPSLFASIAFSGGSNSPAGDDGTSEASGGGVRERLVNTLSENFSNPLIAVLITLIAGLASAATPCVYPMIPITARILMGRGGDDRAAGRLHAFMYFLGIVLVYAVLGIIAASTGGAFNELLRLPLVILSFAVLFTLLGLSMLGLYEIQLPAALTTKVDGATSSRSGLAGTALMGVGAGLVVSPCVGPVVVFILTQVAARITELQAAGATTAGQIAYGGYLMAGYGAGLGVPFLIVGVLSARMAKPGSWMTFVRVALGLVILYFAWDYFHKALATAGVDRTYANAILTGIVLIFFSVFWGVFRTKTEEGPHAGWHKVRLASTIIMLIVGIFFLWTGLSRSALVGGTPIYVGGADGTRGAASAAIENTNGLEWHRDFDAALAQAANENKPIFVDFYAHWCANCKVFSKQAQKKGTPLYEKLDSVVLAKIYDTDPIFDEFRSDPRFPELKVGLPFFLVLDPSGEYRWKTTNYRDHDGFIRELDKAAAERGV